MASFKEFRRREPPAPQTATCLCSGLVVLATRIKHGPIAISVDPNSAEDTWHGLIYQPLPFQDIFVAWSRNP